VKFSVRTKNTLDSMNLSVRFSLFFGTKRYSGHEAKLRELPPDVLTTGGQGAPQAMVLEREGEPAIVVGWANGARQISHVFDYECARMRHRARGGVFAIEPADYAQFVDKVREFLRMVEVNLVIEQLQPQELAALAAAAPSNRRTVLAIVLVVVLLVAALAAGVLLLR
jgi:hypothetical protein